ncbi:MAG: CpaF family protein [Euzebya sp.]
MSGAVAMDPELVVRVRRRMASTVATATGPAAVRAAVAAALAQEGITLSPARMAPLVRDLADHVAGLGPLERLLRQPGVTDVMVNGPAEVWVERDGRLQRTDVAFPDDDALLEAVRRVVGPHGHRIDRTRPFVDAKLADGSRLHAVGAPIVTDGTLVTLRRYDARTISWSDLISTDAVPERAAELIGDAVRQRAALVVCGRTGTGKTTLLQRILSDVADNDRVVLIEDAPELRPTTSHLVRMETRPPSAEGSGAVDIATLVRQALRMRPDRIVIGEVRGVEIADVLQAMITGHEGCMTTVHASSAEQALIRLEGMALLAGLPLAAAQVQLASALDLIVALDRGPDGRRGVTEIAQVTAVDRVPVATPIWRRQGWS